MCLCGCVCVNTEGGEDGALADEGVCVSAGQFSSFLLRWTEAHLSYFFVHTPTPIHTPTHKHTHTHTHTNTGLNDAMDDATLLSTLTTLRSETHTHTQKLATLRAAAGSGKPLLDKNQLMKLEKEFVRVRGLWVSRKRKVMDVIGQIADVRTLFLF